MLDPALRQMRKRGGMEGSFALLLFAAFFHFVDPGERKAPKERPRSGGDCMHKDPDHRVDGGHFPERFATA